MDWGLSPERSAWDWGLSPLQVAGTGRGLGTESPLSAMVLGTQPPQKAQSFQSQSGTLCGLDSPIEIGLSDWGFLPLPIGGSAMMDAAGEPRVLRQQHRL